MHTACVVIIIPHLMFNVAGVAIAAKISILFAPQILSEVSDSSNFYAAQRLSLSRKARYTNVRLSDDTPIVHHHRRQHVVFSRASTKTASSHGRRKILLVVTNTRCSRDATFVGRHLRHRFGHDEQRRRDRHGLWENGNRIRW